MISKQTIGYTKTHFMNVSPKLFKRIINIYPPYLGAGIKVEYIGNDWKEIHVSLALRWYNRNAVGTHFGGSLYSMVDPHLMILLMQLLGKEYLIWDKSANIEYIKASKKKPQSSSPVDGKGRPALEKCEHAKLLNKFKAICIPCRNRSKLSNKW